MTSVSRGRWRWAARLGYLVLLSAFCANAQQAPPDDPDSHTRTAARTLASQGAEAFEQRDYQTALDLFQRAGALVQAPTIVLMEARTLVELGRLVEAADKYSAAKNMSDAESSNETLQMAIEAAATEEEALKARIPLLSVRLSGDADTQSAQVWVDGRQLPEALIGVDNPLNPGRHHIEVRRSGRHPIERHVNLREGDRQELVVEIAVEPPKPTLAPAYTPAAPPVAETDEAAALPTESSNTLAWIALGAGAGATLVGAVTGAIALNAKSELDRVCDPGCPPSHADDIQTFRTYRTVSYASFGLGLAGLAWGGYVLLVGTPKTPNVALGVTLQGARLEGTF